MLPVLLILVALLGVAPNAAAIEVKNDGYTPGQAANFQGGFAAGEAAGASLSSGCGPTRLEFARFMFGGASGQQTVTLQVFDDSAGTATPGTSLHNADYQITANDTNLAQVDLRAFSINVPARFRIALQFQHGELPSIASDSDGNQVSSANWIRIDSGWLAASTLGVSSDWIIRGEVTCTGEIFSDGFESAPVE